MSDTESKSESKKAPEALFVTPIAKPLANKSLEKKVLKLIKRGMSLCFCVSLPNPSL